MYFSASAARLTSFSHIVCLRQKLPFGVKYIPKGASAFAAKLSSSVFARDQSIHWLHLMSGSKKVVDSPNRDNHLFINSF